MNKLKKKRYYEGEYRKIAFSYPQMVYVVVEDYMFKMIKKFYGKIKRRYKISSYDMVLHIIYLCNKYEYEYNYTKIMILLYICYCIFLVELDIILLDERPEAWSSGVVFVNAITWLSYIHDRGYPKGIGRNIRESDVLLNCKQLRSVIGYTEEIIKTLGKKMTLQLYNWSIAEGSPWEKRRHSRNKKLSNREIKRHFKTFYKFSPRPYFIEAYEK